MCGNNKGKRCVKLAVSLFVFIADWLLTRVRRGAAGASPASCVVLYYHSIPDEHRAMFAAQMDDILRYAEPIRAASRSRLAAGLRHVSVTFDDAFESVFHNALPELKARQIPATIFVVYECLGRFPSWQRFSPGCRGSDRVMTAEQLLALPFDLVDVGSHTRTHPVLTSLSDQEARREIIESRAMLEKLSGRRITLFSFPYGAFNQQLIKCCKEAGYERVFTISPVFALSDPEEFVAGRVAVEPNDWRIEFRLKLFGAYRWLNSAVMIKQRIMMCPGIRRLWKRIKTPEATRCAAS